MQLLQSKKIISLLQHLTDDLCDRWKRKRKQSPKSVFLTLLIIALNKGITTRRALTLLADIYPSCSSRKEPSPAAFCKIRKNMSDDDMRGIFKTIADSLPQMPSLYQLRLNGLLPVSIDGSQVITPNSKSTAEDFGYYESRNPSHSPQCRLISTWNVFERKPIDWRVGYCHESERGAAVDMIPSISKNNLVLLDRGFFGVHTMKSFKDRGIPCLMRVKQGKSTWLSVQEFLRGNKRDGNIIISDKEGVELKCRIIKKKIYSKRKKKYIQYAFITTLFDKVKWTAKLLFSVYRYRWDVETAFREMKILDKLESFCGKSSLAIKQEIAAYMIARLLTSAVCGVLHHKKSTIDGTLTNKEMTCNHVTVMELLSDCVIKINTETKSVEVIFLHRLFVSLSAMQKKRPKRIYPFKCNGRYGRWKGTKNYRKKAKELELPGYK